MKTMEELGLYGEQPDRKATAVTPDAQDPSFAQVTFNDGTMETMPTSQAEALPFEASVPPYDPATYGPPAAPAGAAGAPEPAAAPGFTPDPGFAPVAPVDPSVNPNVVPAGPNVVRGDSFRPEGSLPSSSLQASIGTGDAAPQTDYGEIVAPGSPGGFGVAGQTETTSTSQQQTVDDPSVMQGRVDDAALAEAEGQRLRDEMKFSSQRDSLDTELDARNAQEQELQRQLRAAELERAEHERIVKAIDSTPIDEDAFWSESPARTAGAWVALALSGFLQGATRGQNPALNQMVQALNHAQDRFIQTQLRQKDSALQTRIKLMGDSKTAIDSLKMQLSGVMEKRIQLDAQREGLQPPPALSTYLAQGAQKRAEALNAIGSRVQQTVAQQLSTESRATPATGPQTRFDVELRGLGVQPEKHQKAMESGLGDQVAGAVKVAKIRDALKQIADANGGDLPAQSTLSWSQLKLAPLAARLGIKNADEQVTTQQLLTQSTLAYMESLKSLKGIDANAEREKFEQSINTGVAGSTLAALDSAVQRAESSALSTASAYAGGNARRYVELLKGQQNEPERGAVNVRRTVSPPTEAQTIQQQGAGGAAPGPLAAGPNRPEAKAPETSTTGSRPGTYRRLRESKLSGPR